MDINDKKARLESCFNKQKKLLENLNFKNFFETATSIKAIELQNEIIKAIPTTKASN